MYLLKLDDHVVSHDFYAQILFNGDKTELFLIYSRDGIISAVSTRIYEGIIDEADIDKELKDKLGVVRKDDWQFAFIKDQEGNLVGSNMCPVTFLNPGRFMVHDYQTVVEYRKKIDEREP